MRVQILLTDRRTGQKLIDKTVLDRAEFRTTLNEDLATVRKELVEDLARKIVLALESSF